MTVIEDIEKKLSDRHRNRSEFMEHCISLRLSKSLATYSNYIELNNKTIEAKDELKVIRRL